MANEKAAPQCLDPGQQWESVHHGPSLEEERVGRASASPPESHLSQLQTGFLQLVYMKQTIIIFAMLNLALKSGELLVWSK
jgi:hypothetical protein